MALVDRMNAFTDIRLVENCGEAGKWGGGEYGSLKLL